MLRPKYVLTTLLFVVGVVSQVCGQGSDSAKFSSKMITTQTPGHAVDVDVDITGAKKLFLVVNDAGNGFSCDWADWAEPRLVSARGEVKLTDLKWTSAQTGWGSVNVNKNADGKAMRINGKPVEYGIGTHANSVIAFDLPEGCTRFKARGGLDNGGTDQGTRASSVQFEVYLDKLPALAVKAPPALQGGRAPGDAIANLDVGEGMEATLFAAEPMLLSPTNIDVDARGRVWVCEVVNYRGRNGTRKEGDRILILEDTDGDGKADRTKVYYQGRDVDSAMGVCVLGNKVIVSCSPNVFIFTDEDGDDIPDKKELLFTKTGQAQHDHSAHAFLFGPDGRMYWNFGNTGSSVSDKHGKPVVDLAGNVVNASAKPYRGGMAFRCNLDGSAFEVLGHNFRNNYEVTVDSFGTLWQSDNDDDGNRGVRINYLMEFGNYGYQDEMTGAGWKTTRTNMESDIASQHWHQNDPGVVPNLLHTGAGSPTGICVYEGRLLPKRFWNQVIHCDAGPSIVRAYPAKTDGAGYKASSDTILEGTRDKWFRPSDVCVAPDGSLIVADWYDPNVGGHGMGDIDRGRVFRVAPPRSAYTIPKYDYSTAEGAVEALKNPALSVRYLAWTALNKMQAKAETALLKMLDSKEEPQLRARALWVLGHIDNRGKHYIDVAASDADADIRIVGLRLARQLNLELMPTMDKLAHDPSPAVRRECALALRGNDSPKATALWVELASQHNGKDRWYLEALGIAADNRWDARLEAFLAKAGDKWNTPAGRDIVWRSRAEKTPSYLAKIIGDPSLSKEDLPRYLRAFDFQTGSEKESALIQLAFAGKSADAARQNLIASESLSRLKNFDVNRDPKYKAALEKVLDQARGTSQFVELVARFNMNDRYPELLALAQKNATAQIGVDAIVALLSTKQNKLIEDQLKQKDVKLALATAEVLGTSKDGRAYGLLKPFVADAKCDLQVRRQAVRSLARLKNGAQELATLAEANKLDPTLKEAAAAALHQAEWPDIKSQASRLFPLPASKNEKPLPPIGELVKLSGDAKRGLDIFKNAGTCAKCHVVGKEGKEVGPNLSEIGDKLSREAMFESIVFPNAAISHNYESYLVALNNGTVVTGLLVSETPEAVSLKDAEAIVRVYKKAEIEETKKQPISMMPADLMKTMSQQDLVDVVSYLLTLRKNATQKTSLNHTPATKATARTRSVSTGLDSLTRVSDHLLSPALRRDDHGS